MISHCFDAISPPFSGYWSMKNCEKNFFKNLIHISFCLPLLRETITKYATILIISTTEWYTSGDITPSSRRLHALMATVRGQF